MMKYRDLLTSDVLVSFCFISENVEFSDMKHKTEMNGSDGGICPHFQVIFNFCHFEMIEFVLFTAIYYRPISLPFKTRKNALLLEIIFFYISHVFYIRQPAAPPKNSFKIAMGELALRHALLCVRVFLRRTTRVSFLRLSCR